MGNLTLKNSNNGTSSISLYNNNYYIKIQPNTLSTNRTLYLPNCDGTIMTSGNINLSSSWTDGSSSGPILKLTLNGTSHSLTAIPAASSSTSGIITTGTQTFSGAKLFLDNIIVKNGAYGSSIAFQSTRSTDKASLGAITFYSIGSSNSTAYDVSAFYFVHYSYASDTYTKLDYYDRFYLPSAAANKATNDSYAILTSKKAVTIAQGGTGATTRANGYLSLLYGGVKNVDYNTLTDAGLYWIQPGGNSNCVNYPAGCSYGYLEVLSSSSIDTLQRVTQYNTGKTWVRTNINGWQNWVEYITSTGGTINGNLSIGTQYDTNYYKFNIFRGTNGNSLWLAGNAEGNGGYLGVSTPDGTQNQITITHSGTTFSKTIVTPGMTVSARAYFNEWISFSNGSGLVWPNSYNSYFFPNAYSSYGNMCILGTKGGYCGLHLGSASNGLTIMDNGTNYEGLYSEGVDWLLFRDKTNGRIGIKTASLGSYDVTVGGSLQVNSAVYTGSYFRTSNYGSSAPTSSTAGYGAAGAIYYKV